MPEPSSRLRIILAAIILIPILLYWGFGHTPQESAVKTSPLSEKMDYFVDQANIREWKENGKLTRELLSERVEHNPTLELNHLTKPKNISYRDDGSQIIVTSLEGQTLDNNSRTDLAGGVIVHDNPSSEKGAVLTTEQISIYPQQDYAKTEHPVKISTSTGHIEGVGMDVNFNKRVLNLHSSVKGAHSNAK